jgi:hypothetical protein
MTFTFEEHVEADDSVLPCTFQETDDICTEYKKTKTDDEKLW